MKHDGYSYAVEAEVTFTGRDLEVMRTCAEDHYDFDCQSFFKAGNRGYGWVNQFISSALWGVPPALIFRYRFRISSRVSRAQTMNRNR